MNQKEIDAINDDGEEFLDWWAEIKGIAFLLIPLGIITFTFCSVISYRIFGDWKFWEFFL